MFSLICAWIAVSKQSWGGWFETPSRSLWCNCNDCWKCVYVMMSLYSDLETTYAHCLWNNFPLQWHHNEYNGVSNHRRLDCLLNRLSRRKSKKTSKLRVTGLCAGNSPVTGEFPAQMVSVAENVSIWWGHPDKEFLRKIWCHTFWVYYGFTAQDILEINWDDILIPPASYWVATL